MKRNPLQSKYFYHNSKKWSIIIFLVFALLSGNIFCQQKSKKKFKTTTSTKSIKKTSSYDISPFDLNIKQLPIDYKGVNPLILYNQLENRSSNLIKSEYETTLEFQSRQLVIRDKLIVGKIGVDSLIALKLGIAKYKNIKIKYNADTEMMNIKIKLDDLVNIDYKYDDTKRKNELIEEDNSSTYIGSNAFGATKEVTKSKTTSYNILFENWQCYSNSIEKREMQGLGNNLSVDLKIDAITAKRIDENANDSKNSELGCLYIGTLTEPYISKGYFYNAATFEDPTEYSKSYKYINLTVHEIWLFNTKTGQIYNKLKCMNNNSINPKKSNVITNKMPDDIL